MDDEVPIHVEPGGTDGPGGAGRGDAWSGPGASSRRVVHEPGARTRLVAVLVVAGLVVGGLLVSLRGGGGDGPDDRPPPESADDAYAAAIRRLGRAGSFSYRGTVQATGRSPLRPGTWLDAEVTVEGAVLLPHSITREVAVAPDGRGAVETVTSASMAWSRTASSRSELPSVPWELVAWTDSGPGLPSTPNPESFASRRLGIALVADVLRAAGNRRPGPSEAGGNRALHATVPIGGGHRVHSGDLAAAGVDPLELSRLPSGWALTGAQEARTGRVVMCGGGAGRCIASDEGCPVLHLDYRDVTQVSGGWLSLSIMSESCFTGRSGTGGDRWAEPFRAGRFTGSVDESATTIGAVSDGETTVGFSTDLSATDAEAVLATLAPFDAATEPAVLPATSTSTLPRR